MLKGIRSIRSTNKRIYILEKQKTRRKTLIEYNKFILSQLAVNTNIPQRPKNPILYTSSTAAALSSTTSTRLPRARSLFLWFSLV